MVIAFPKGEPLPAKHKTENCLYTTASDEGLMETMFPCPLEIKFFETNNFRGRKEMTTKKSKNPDLTHKTDYTKYRPKEATKKKNQNTKRIDTFSPVSNEEAPKK